MVTEYDFAPGIYFDIPADVYHKIPYLSASYLKRFAVNPATAQMPVEATPNMILGSASHVYTLEGVDTFNEQFVVAPTVDKRTNKGKEIWAQFEKENVGKTLLTQDQFAIVIGIDKSVNNHPLVSMFMKQSQGRPEVTLIWQDKETGLMCKCRIDRMPSKDKAVVFDFKTCGDSSRKAFPRQIVNLNYDLQAAWYKAGAIANGIRVDAFIFISAQTSGTYPINAYYLNDEWMSWAELECRRLLCLEAECRTKGHYPNYEIPKHITSIQDMTLYDLLEELEMPAWR